MAEIQLACENEACPGRFYNEDGDLEDVSTWWTGYRYSRAVGATDWLSPDCPECGEVGEATGEVE